MIHVYFKHNGYKQNKFSPNQEHSIHQQVEKEKEHLKGELQNMKKDAAETKAYIDAQQAEERKLLKIIQEADAERSRQKKQLEQVNISRFKN